MSREKRKKAKTSQSKKAIQEQPAQAHEILEEYILVDEPPQNGSGVAHQVVQQSYQGPIPPASELAKYNGILPDAAERILRMAEADGEHQRSMEKLAIKYQKEDISRGQNYALFVSLAAFGTAITLAALGHPTAAGIVGGTTVVSLAVAFITGRKSAKKK